MKKITYNKEKEYEGHNNERIISLVNDLNDCLINQRNLERQINDIRNVCDHEYMIVCPGAYKDFYACRKCGHETEN